MIVVVDDEQMVTSAFKTLLKLEGFNNCVTFNNPVEAVEFLKEHKPDIIVSDFIMPEMNGLEFLTKAKELYPNVDLVTMDITMPRMDGITALEQIMAFDKNAKVVMISALGKEELVKKSLLIGAKNYIVKPLDRKKVLERISSALK